ncbi:cupin domain-containing protein [Candidatus Roizmanbacteria bacterium]|nr:cupin domain-containing protein [Candidatus Roizmanbacteria bacterium]
MKKLHTSQIQETVVHGGAKRKLLIAKDQGHSSSHLQTMNDAHLEPGETFEPHAHADSEEIFYFLEGYGEMTVDGETFDITPGGVIVIEKDEQHSVKNTGEETLRFITVRVLH